MSIFNKGILGGFSGTIGTIVGYNWRGLDVMRSRPKKSNRKASPAQLEVRARFAVTSHFLAQIKEVLAVYFGAPSGSKSRFNQAFTYHRLEALSGTYPNFQIDYPKVIISKGELLGVDQPAVAAQAGAALRFTWQDNSGLGQAKATDGLLVVVYNPARDVFAYRTQAAMRADGVFLYELPPTWVGNTAHIWISMTNPTGQKCANSLYLGAVALV
ncbi:hypothetical protein KIH23_02675 [Flavobacterium sp. CYK-55]|uniref:DUF6266 family protein n=1 Tax=Flavobacterium sp. CYK-55 TaxID=2835529 RepID=UPI001BD00BF8|nr:DUF6266 family protein [Flavobacterium sp. CYK-55]MBS7786189.1 hypothetical protein [Flavobacterium sp. CYK-55]